MYTKTGSTNTSLFTATGNKGRLWLRGTGTINSNTPYTIVFEAVRGANYNGDIALDDISVAQGICSLQTTPGVTQPTVAPTQGITSSFKMRFMTHLL